MKEIIDGVLFIFFGSIAITILYVAIKIYKCPSWKYDDARKKKFSGLAIDIKNNRWSSNEVISETAINEILQ